MKTCSVCKKDLALDDFYTCKGYPKSSCKKCEKAAKAAWYQANRNIAISKSSLYQTKVRNVRTAYSRKWRLKNVYKITEAEYDRLFTEQAGRCRICQRHRDELGKELCVDHCHETGKIRGLLCHACNAGIGYLRHNPENLGRAISYLQGVTT